MGFCNALGIALYEYFLVNNSFLVFRMYNIGLPIYIFHIHTLKI